MSRSYMVVAITAAIVALVLRNVIVTLIALVIILAPPAVKLMLLAGEADDPREKEKYNMD